MIGFALGAAILGAAWRRWLGSEGGRRSLIMGVGFVLFFIVATYATGVWWHGLLVAGVLTAGFAFGHTYDPWWPLVWRYGLVTVSVAGLLLILGHPWFVLTYAPVGCFVPLGYIAGKRLKLSCWSCLGEVWMGALILGPLALL